MVRRRKDVKRVCAVPELALQHVRIFPVSAGVWLPSIFFCLDEPETTRLLFRVSRVSRVDLVARSGCIASGCRVLAGLATQTW
jgi:hypothetical protein